MKLRDGEVFIDVYPAQGGGVCLCVGDESSGYRLAGPKPHGRSLHQFRVNAAELRKQLDQFEQQPTSHGAGVSNG